MKYKPYSPNWTRYRELQRVLYDYLEDANTSPEVIGEDIQDILEEWINDYSSRADKGNKLKNLFR